MTNKMLLDPFILFSPKRMWLSKRGLRTAIRHGTCYKCKKKHYFGLYLLFDKFYYCPKHAYEIIQEADKGKDVRKIHNLELCSRCTQPIIVEKDKVTYIIRDGKKICSECVLELEKQKPKKLTKKQKEEARKGQQKILKKYEEYEKEHAWKGYCEFGKHKSSQAQCIRCKYCDYWYCIEHLSPAEKHECTGKLENPYKGTGGGVVSYSKGKTTYKTK